MNLFKLNAQQHSKVPQCNLNSAFDAAKSETRQDRYLNWKGIAVRGRGQFFSSFIVFIIPPFCQIWSFSLVSSFAQRATNYKKKEQQELTFYRTNSYMSSVSCLFCGIISCTNNVSASSHFIYVSNAATTEDLVKFGKRVFFKFMFSPNWNCITHGDDDYVTTTNVRSQENPRK